MRNGSYEVQLFRNGGWEINSIYPNRQQALSEAEQLRHSGRRIRVIEEKHDFNTGAATASTICRYDDRRGMDDWLSSSKNASDENGPDIAALAGDGLLQPAARRFRRIRPGIAHIAVFALACAALTALNLYLMRMAG